jgi:hypothetical protein
VVLWTDVVSNSWSSFPSETAPFFWNVFFLRFYVSFPMVSSMNRDNFGNSLVLYLAFFCFKFFALYTYLKFLRSFSVIFPWDLCLHLGNSKIFGWNHIISFFLIPSALISLFLLGLGIFSELHACFALLDFFLRTLTGPYSIH